MKTINLIQHFKLAFNESAGRFTGTSSFLTAILVSYSIPASGAYWAYTEGRNVNRKQILE